MVVNSLNEIIANPALAHRIENHSYLIGLANKYPYFELVHILTHPIHSVAAKFAMRPFPSILLYDTSAAPEQVVVKPQVDENEDLAAPFMTLDDSMISETLAAIFVAQGEKERAKDIYFKLSLKNPEKSSYFVGLIEQL